MDRPASVTRSVGVERAEVVEQAPGNVERPARRRIQERQVVGRCAPHRQLERETREVDGDDLRIRVRPPSGLFHLGPEAVGHPRLGAPGAPGALVGRGPRVGPGAQSGEAAARVVARTADLAAVDDHPDALDREAGLGDVGGEDHPAATGR